MSYAPFTGYTSLTTFSNGIESTYRFDTCTNKLYHKLKDDSRSSFASFVFIGLICLIIILGLIISLAFTNKDQHIYMWMLISLVAIGGFFYLSNLNNQSIVRSKQITQLLKTNQVS